MQLLLVTMSAGTECRIGLPSDKLQLPSVCQVHALCGSGLKVSDDLIYAKYSLHLPDDVLDGQTTNSCDYLLTSFYAHCKVNYNEHQRQQ